MERETLTVLHISHCGNSGLFALCILSPQLYVLIVVSLPKTSERKMEFFSLFVHPSYYHPPRSPFSQVVCLDKRLLVACSH